MTTYRVTFDRIGRNHHVEPMTADADGPNHLAEAVYDYAKPHLLSRDIDVTVDLAAGKGQIWAGFNNGGTFTVGQVCPSTHLHDTTWAYRRYGCRCPEAVKRMRTKRRHDSRMPSAKVRRARYQAARRDEARLPDEIAIEQACRGRRVRLTPIERRAAIDRLDARGLSARQVAERLHITTRTVTRHRAARRATSTRSR